MTKPAYKRQSASAAPEAEQLDLLSLIPEDDQPEVVAIPVVEVTAGVEVSDEDDAISDSAGSGLFVDILEKG